MTMEVRNKKVVLKHFITGTPNQTDMEVQEGEKLVLEVPDEAKGAVLVKNLYLSCDPFMRGRMLGKHDSYIPPFQPGSPIEGFGVCKVVESSHPDFSKGDLVSGMTSWEEYSLIRETNKLRKIDSNEFPLSYHVGLLGMPGFTAYAGFYEVCKPKKGETVFVSAASGAVGQIVGQLAKLFGCYVVGSAGSQQKIELLKNKLGFDDAFNYKEESDLVATLKRYFPQGIDIYFDNVGGPTLNAALLNMCYQGRIAMCGMVSQQSLSNPDSIQNAYVIIQRSLTLKGFLQHDYIDVFPRFLEVVGRAWKEGRIVYVEDLSEGIENTVEALVGLFQGRNVGKKVVRVANE
ncbi:hypothetical protein LUZ60_001931 [Juncus effusus]|nr:hypothetical protein LUZ60_001931 [Juncus effusus]